ncbi:LCP family protein [Metabacillus indicus]|uniref:LCP family protein n=1 Tax=Metabacillus indicus TaxID=246786 RepID=UPI00049306E6|nr:LCP family protein [Metabacillus indicus]KEZ48766.1 LytR family transcriptional regulator [Metabacillus indicus LMG 22858]
MENGRRYQKKKRKNSIFRRILGLLLLIAIISGAYFGYLFYTTYQAANESYTELERGNKSKLREQEVQLSNDPVSILFIGVEDYSSGGQGGRTDSILVGTFNPKTQNMKLLSIPRDTRVEIPGTGRSSKINSAYGKGGIETTIDTVENLLNIPIDYYATVNFEGFKEIVDEVGGVTVDVPFDFWEYTDTKPRQKIYFKEGKAKLDGEEALAYARMRKRDPRGDFGRNDRQKQIVMSTIDSILKPNNLLKIDDVSRHIGQNVETNIRVSEGLAFANKYKNFNSKDIDQLTLEGSDATIGGGYYFIPSEESIITIQSELKQHLEADKTTP